MRADPAAFDPSKQKPCTQPLLVDPTPFSPAIVLGEYSSVAAPRGVRGTPGVAPESCGKSATTVSWRPWHARSSRPARRTNPSSVALGQCAPAISSRSRRQHRRLVVDAGAALVANRPFGRTICRARAQDTHVPERITAWSRVRTLGVAKARDALPTRNVAVRGRGRSAIRVLGATDTEASGVAGGRIHGTRSAGCTRCQAVPRRFARGPGEAVGRAAALHAYVTSDVAARQNLRAVEVAQARDAGVRRGVAMQGRQPAIGVQRTRRRSPGPAVGDGRASALGSPTVVRDVPAASWRCAAARRRVPGAALGLSAIVRRAPAARERGSLPGRRDAWGVEHDGRVAG